MPRQPDKSTGNSAQGWWGLDVYDTREKLEIYAKAGLLSLGAGAALASLGHGAAPSKK